MAYDPENPPALIAQNIGGTEGMRWYGLYWIDPIADVLTPGYISNAIDIGMRAGDGFRYKDTNRGEWDQYDLIVGEINADGSADLAFPEQPEEAYPESIVEESDDAIEILGFKAGRLTRLTFGEFARTTSTVRVEQFGLVTAAAFATTFAAALEFADEEKKALSFTPLQDYYTEEQVTVDRDVSIIGNNARLLRAASGDDNFSILEVNGAFTNTNAVVAVTTDTIDYSGGTGGTSIVTKLEMASSAIASQYAVGDNVKLISDALIPSSRPSDNERVGEMFTIGAISGAFIYGLSVLTEAYAGNIRLSKMSTKRADIRNLRLTDEPGSSILRRKPLLNLVGLVDSYLENIEMRNALTLGIQRQSCYRARSLFLRAIKLRTVNVNTDYVGDPGTFAYTLCGIGDQGGHDIAPYGQEVRHVVTTGANNISATNSPDIARYGASMNWKIDDLHGHDTSHYAADTHSDAFNVEFNNVKRSGGHQGVLGSIYAVQLRGRNCKVNGLQSYGRGGVLINDGGGLSGGGHVVENFEVERPASMTSTGSMIRVDTPLYTEKCKLTLRGKVKCNSGYNALVELINADISEDSQLTFEYGYKTGGAPINVDVTNSRIRGEWNFDWSKSDIANTSSITVFEIQAEDTGGTDIAPKRLSFRCAEAADSVVIANLQNEVARIVIPDGPDGDVGGVSASSTGFGGFTNVGVGSVVHCAPRRAQGTLTERKSVTNTFSVTGEQSYDPAMWGYDDVLHRVNASVAGVIINNLPAGLVDGQIFVFSNSLATPAENIVLKNGNRFSFGGSNITLNPYDVVMLQWTISGGLWRPIGGYGL